MPRGVRVQTINDQPSLTVQSDAKRADIRQILKKYKQVGIVDHLNHVQARWADVTEFTDLSDALRQARVAEEEFMKLPSKVREIFNHDVTEWLDTAHDPAKREAHRADFEKLGLIETAPEGSPPVDLGGTE